MGSKEIRVTFRNLAIQRFLAKYLVKVISALELPKISFPF